MSMSAPTVDQLRVEISGLGPEEMTDSVHRFLDGVVSKLAELERRIEAEENLRRREIARLDSPAESVRRLD